MLTILAFVSLVVCAQNVHMDGRASYYHNSLHGRKMANGERYNRDSMICAHRTLPFGTRLRVTNPVTGQQVIVRVADRGPFVRGRVIDLSYAAASRLGTLRSGVAMVQIEILPKETEIPYRNPEVIQLPKVEYGSVGVCYEYMPEWEKVKPEPRRLPRKVNTNARRNSKPATRKPAQQQAQGQQQSQQHTSTEQQQQQRRQPQRHKPKQEDGSSWSNFFDRIKNGVTSLFD